MDTDVSHTTEIEVCDGELYIRKLHESVMKWLCISKKIALC